MELWLSPFQMVIWMWCLPHPPSAGKIRPSLSHPPSSSTVTLWWRKGSPSSATRLLTASTCSPGTLRLSVLSGECGSPWPFPTSVEDQRALKCRVLVLSPPEQKGKPACVHVQLLLPLCVEHPGHPASSSSSGTGTIEWAWRNYSIP